MVTSTPSAAAAWSFRHLPDHSPTIAPEVQIIASEPEQADAYRSFKAGHIVPMMRRSRLRMA
jgi:hypothetical protein